MYTSIAFRNSSNDWNSRTVEQNGKQVTKPKSTLHGLRHTHATILLNSGQNVKVIAERLGNTPAMIYEIYGHILKELEEKSVEVFSNSLKLSKY